MRKHSIVATFIVTHTSLSVKTNGKQLAAIGNAIGKWVIDKTIASNGEEINNAMIGNNVLVSY